MPSLASQGGSTKASYTYLADGAKTMVSDASGNGFAYLGSLIYTKSGSSYTLESCDFSSGRIVNSSGTLTPYYHTTDHLGSVRMITTNGGRIVEQNDYFPFGGKHTSGQSYATLATNKYKFNGKEEQTTGGIGYLDYGARMYDDVLGRWGTQDPLVEKYYGHSPYNFSANNPVAHLDPNGKVWDIFWDIGNVVYDAGAAIYQHIKGDHKTAKSHWKDAAFDLVAAAIPFVPAGASKLVKGADKAVDVVKSADKIADGKKTYQTYTKTNPRTGEVYTGRTSGNRNPYDNVANRDKNHHMNKKGFGPAALDESSINHNAIRGREQYQINKYGGSKSTGGTSGNSINGISPKNPRKKFYEEEMKKVFNDIK